MRISVTVNSNSMLEGKGKQFIHLGSHMQVHGDIQKERISQLGKMAAEFTRLNKIWSSKIYNLKTKLQINSKFYFYFNIWM